MIGKNVLTTLRETLLRGDILSGIMNQEQEFANRKNSVNCRRPQAMAAASLSMCRPNRWTHTLPFISYDDGANIVVTSFSTSAGERFPSPVHSLPDDSD